MFEVGQKVEMIESRKFPELLGEVGVVLSELMPSPYSGRLSYLVSIVNPDTKRPGYALPRQLKPIEDDDDEYDRFEAGSWDQCIFKPEGVSA